MEESSQHFPGPLFKRVPPRARPALMRVLRGIEPDPNGTPRAFFETPSRKVTLGWGDPLEPWQAQFVLGDIIGCRDFGKGEKLAWEFALKFEGLPMTVAFQKFGLRAYVDPRADEVTAEQAAKRMAETISRSMPLLEKTVLADIADEQVERGQVNIRNHYSKLENQYQRFRDLSEASLVAAGKAEPAVETDPGDRTR